MTRDDPAQFAPPPAFGPFRVLHQVGVGALGPVFRAYEPTRDRLIAVKVFRLDITPEQAQALADELSRSADAGLFHPSIVEPVAAGVEGTVAYRAEEYVAAESLDIAIRHYAPAPMDKALPFITQLAGAIDFARAAGVGHGALHLRDIFVTPDEARASGFGVVEALERVGLRAPVRRPYTAPERIAGQPWGTTADVFSLAAISYELLTGRRPSGTGPQIGPLNDAAVGEHADRVHAVLARGMAEDPAARYDAALAFASALEAAARGEGVTGAVAQVGAISAATAAAPVVTEAEPYDALSDEEAIALERGLDEAHHDLSIDEQARRDAEDLNAGAAGLLFDEEDERLEDLALESPPERFVDPEGAGLDSTRDEPEWRRDRSARAAAPIAAAGHAGAFGETRFAAEEPVRPVPAAQPPRTAILPLVVMLTIGLLVGFLAGYALGGRSLAGVVGEGGQEARGAAGQEDSPAGTGDPAQEFSEQTVTPSPGATPPAPVPAEPPAPSAADAAPPAPTTGTIVVRSTPGRANVTVNGRWRGRTPLTLDEVAFGSYAIRVVQDGYEVAEESVRISEDTPARTLSVTLERRAAPAPRRATPPPARTPPAAPRAYTGSIYVDSRPRGARVYLDGKQIGTTPLSIPEVPIGSHVVRLELDNHRTWTSSTRVVAGEERRVTGSLEQIR